MLELYLFIASLVAIVAIVAHRVLVAKKEDEKAFKKEVSARVKENRKLEKEEEVLRFKDEHLRGEGAKKTDIPRFREEMRRADLAIAKKDFGTAKRALIQAMSLTKDDLPVALKLGELYMQTEDHQKAEALYKKLMDEDPENPVIYENLGRIMLKKKNYKKSIQSYVRAVELDEKDDQKFLALGKLYHLMMRYSLAAECFKRAAEIKPRETEYLFLLADSCVFDDDYENALFTYERILTIEPYNEKAKDATQAVRLKIKEQENLFT